MTDARRRIFITGGASGLGREPALRFASAGWLASPARTPKSGPG